MVQEQQPSASHQMSHKPTEGLVSSYSQGAAKEAGKETVKYVAENPMTQQQLSDAEAKAQQGYEDAKQQAQGMWAKYCGCLGSVA
ncbi:hypothetical protein PILCRDRAFT_820392 [Piloderma croceum F 1598]|uniref:Uncharacterized protein n=1 Tax=Piloderma croceum (strain F 1598) TaxID=765440 RepID=A0A0C3B8A8_PILCF|nr:hypothetical protein PILCRDRAFT_820392 [Piloderma croceum F 1598]